MTITISLLLNEHCIILLEHARQLRRHLKRNQKTILKTRVLKIFDCLKNLIVKLHVQSKIFDLQRVLKKINYMHQDLTKIIFFLSILKSDSTCQKKKQIKTMNVSANDLSVIVKHCNKDVIKRLKSRTITQIVAKTNTIIDRMKNDFRVTDVLTLSNSMTNKVMIFQHLRSENLKLFVRKKKNVRFLSQHFQ